MIHNCFSVLYFPQTTSPSMQTTFPSSSSAPSSSSMSSSHSTMEKYPFLEKPMISSVNSMKSKIASSSSPSFAFPIFESKSCIAICDHTIAQSNSLPLIPEMSDTFNSSHITPHFNSTFSKSSSSSPPPPSSSSPEIPKLNDENMTDMNVIDDCAEDEFTNKKKSGDLNVKKKKKTKKTKKVKRTKTAKKQRNVAHTNDGDEEKEDDDDDAKSSSSPQKVEHRHHQKQQKYEMKLRNFALSKKIKDEISSWQNEMVNKLQSTSSFSVNNNNNPFQSFHRHRNSLCHPLPITDIHSRIIQSSSSSSSPSPSLQSSNLQFRYSSGDALSSMYSRSSDHPFTHTTQSHRYHPYNHQNAYPRHNSFDVQYLRSPFSNSSSEYADILEKRNNEKKIIFHSNSDDDDIIELPAHCTSRFNMNAPPPPSVIQPHFIFKDPRNNNNNINDTDSQKSVAPTPQHAHNNIAKMNLSFLLNE